MSLYSQKDNPSRIVVVDGGNRYSLIPFTLSFYGAIQAYRGARTLQACVFIAMLILCVHNFRPVSLTYFEFESFARLARHIEVVIPINPPSERFPGWHVLGRPRPGIQQPPVGKSVVPRESWSVSNAAFSATPHATIITSEGSDPQIVITGLTCRNASHVGLEVFMGRPAAGWMQLFWGRKGNFTEGRSLRRWYPDGLVNAQFAFPAGKQRFSLRLDPMEEPGEATIYRVQLYCLH
jgi:hypothetical protein